MKKNTFRVVLVCIALSHLIFRFDTLTVYYQQILCWAAVVGALFTILRSREAKEAGGIIFGVLVIIFFQPLGGIIAPINPAVLSGEERSFAQFFLALSFLVAAYHYGKSGSDKN
jgi:hypothetical protein